MALPKEFVDNIKELNSPDNILEFKSKLADVPFEYRAKVAVAAAENLPAEKKEEVAKEISAPAPLPPPNPPVIDLLWKIAVTAFSIVLVGGFIAVAIAAFIPKPSATIVSGELLLSVFTSAAGFLGGLFVPSPAQARNTSNGQR